MPSLALIGNPYFPQVGDSVWWRGPEVNKFTNRGVIEAMERGWIGVRLENGNFKWSAEWQIRPRAERRLPNPIRFTGPSLTFMPFNPFQKVAIDLVGASYMPKASNPYYQHVRFGDKGWEVPPRFWPENMSNAQFDTWVKKQLIGHRMQDLEGPHRVPPTPSTPKARVRLAEINEQRILEGKPEWTYEEWRRWVWIDVIDQLVEQDAIWGGDQPEPGQVFMPPRGGYPAPRRGSRLPSTRPDPTQEQIEAASYSVSRYADELRKQQVRWRAAAEERKKRRSMEEAKEQRKAKRSRALTEREAEHQQRLFGKPFAPGKVPLPTVPGFARIKRGPEKGRGEIRTPMAARGSQIRLLIEELIKVYGSQARLAKALGVSPGTISTSLNMHTKPGLGLTKRIVELAIHHGIAAANPGDLPRKKNRDHRWRKPPNATEISLDEAAGYPGFDKALKAFKRFHKTDPGSAYIVRVPRKGKKGKELAGGVVHVALGVREQTPYVVPFEGSSKEGVRWYHDHPEGTRPMILLNPETGLVTDVGGTYMVDDWFYS